MEASTKGRTLGHTLSDFKFCCVGYSTYLDSKDSSADQPDKPVELPFCTGIQLVVDKVVSEADHGHVHANNEEDGVFTEDGAALPKPRPLKQPQSTGDGFLTRFTRNGSLVASGVSRNMHRMGRYIKDNVDDILYERRRPK
ncbi:Altered inheritance of mitochondria protein [Thalictrum thalictroides]|uniref:Altered inheritance of mitochondria protein n=1 Tax=Thalictrum thalictroides TaxID=46969 RepID=A0A7J6VCP7_THATH|nr:Altered inheritance of mitochondria protein [Thalictrum thalictroides]